MITADAKGATMTRRLDVVSILYDQTPAEIERLTRSVALSGSIAMSKGVVDNIGLWLGNCGDAYPDDFESRLRQLMPNTNLIEFTKNLGHSRGCNETVSRIDDPDPGTFLLLLNPDTVLAPSALSPLIADLLDPHVGATDARQIPFEHPKRFDPNTRSQSWASGACLATRREVFQEVGGFDHENFWSYCNDVDLSWRIQVQGWTVRHTPDSVVFHDKRLTPGGVIEPTASENYYSALGRLNLARRYGNGAVERNTLAWIDEHGSHDHRTAAQEFRARDVSGLLPEELPGAKRVAQFIDGEYGSRRY